MARKSKVETLHQGRFIRLLKQGRWEFADRVKTSGIVMLVPVTRENKLLLIEQFRPPVGKRVIELPAGLAGDIEGSEDEALTVAAKRELEEETGYTASRMKRVAAGPPSAGMVTEIITIYLATGLKKISAGGGDGHEDITVHEVPLSRVCSWLKRKEREGCLIDLKLWAGLYFAERHAAKK
ncbi:MAG: NUDIX hydrolase [Phycisphaeraceae bacterium]